MIATLLLSLTSLAAAAGPTNWMLVDGAVVLCEKSALASEGPYDDEPAYDCAAPQLPAVFDCADAVTVALGDMIGECESTARPLPTTPTATLASLWAPSDDRPVGKRICLNDRCGVERTPPLHNAPRLSDSIPALLPLAWQPPTLQSTYLTIPYRAPFTDGAARGLFRPPRA